MPKSRRLSREQIIRGKLLANSMNQQLDITRDDVLHLLKIIDGLRDLVTTTHQDKPKDG